MCLTENAGLIQVTQHMLIYAQWLSSMGAYYPEFTVYTQPLHTYNYVTGVIEKSVLHRKCVWAIHFLHNSALPDKFSQKNMSDWIKILFSKYVLHMYTIYNVYSHVALARNCVLGMYIAISSVAMHEEKKYIYLAKQLFNILARSLYQLRWRSSGLPMHLIAFINIAETKPFTILNSRYLLTNTGSW